MDFGFTLKPEQSWNPVVRGPLFQSLSHERGQETQLEAYGSTIIPALNGGLGEA